MDVHDLFYACRTGDYFRVRYLVEKRHVDIDKRDKWDSTPLYYACLCGHREVVQYLLDNGAKCQAQTFEGERCLYGALTDDIRNLLKGYSVITTRIMRRDVYEEFLRMLLDNKVYTDFEFSVHGKKIPVHRCILCVRSSFFASLFETKWKNKKVAELNHTMMSKGALDCILQYLYTGRAEMSLDMLDDCLRLAKHCHLDDLVENIELKRKNALTWELSKPGVRVTTLVLEPPLDNSSLKEDFKVLAERAMPENLTTWMIGALPFESDDLVMTFPDVCFEVQGAEFKCHKAFFCYRSDYFKALLKDHFGENKSSGDMPVILLNNIAPDVFARVTCYVYTESCELNSDVVGEVLVAADMFLLPGLKRLCSSSMINYVDINNVIYIIRTARLFNLPSLESCCAEYIANHLFKILRNEDFIQLIVEDAASIKDREETDSIDIIDEIRFYITDFMLTFSEMEEAHEKLKMIDDLLEELCIEG